MSPEAASRQLSEAEALRIRVTRLGPTARAWALAAAASDLERAALGAHPALAPAWAQSPP